MPELPEVETMRRGILAVLGSTIRDVQSGRSRRKPILISPRLDSFRRRVIGAKITAVDRIGKRVVVRLDSDDAIVMEPRMTGLVLLAAPPTLEHLRLRIQLSGGRASEIMYWDRRGLGSVRLLSRDEMGRLLGAEKIGPDALALSADELRARLGRSQRAVKVALLDQRAIAGIGNLYAAEILHLARVHPEKRCSELRKAEWARVYDAIYVVLKAAIKYEGSTLADGTYRNALNESGGYQNHHRVYARAGERCLSCGRGEIQRIVQAQRSTFFCPKCQPQVRKRVKRKRGA